MANNIFMNIDGLPAENIQMIADRLEARAGMERFAGMRDRYFDAMGLANDARILELGAGTGIVGRAYASRDKFAGKYVVTDLSEAFIRFGENKAAEVDLSDLMDFQVVDAITGEGLIDASYDAVILHTLLSHVPDPDAVMRTASNAVRAGGIIAAFDADYASLEIVSGNEGLDDKVSAAIRANAVAQPTIMRRLPRISKGLGLHQKYFQSDFLAEAGKSEFFIGLAQAVCNVVMAQGGLDQSTGDKWLSSLQDAIDQDTFFGMCPYFTYLYRRV